MADTESLDEVEREIQSTRHRIDDRLDALLGKVSASHLIGDAIDGVRQEGGEFAANLGQRVKDNPVATTMAVAGLAWLMLSDRSRRSAGGGYPLPVPVGQSASTSAPDSGESAGDRARSAMRQARETSASAAHAVGGAARSVGDTARQAGDAARGAADTVRSAAQDIGERAARSRDAVVDTTVGTFRGAREATRRAGGFLSENPLMIGALGLAIGGLMAAAMPSTRREDEWVGETADELKRDAGAAARDALREGENVAAAAVKGAEQEAERQDLGPRSAEKALKGGTEVAKAAVRSAGKEARRGGDGNGSGGKADQASTASGSATPSAVPSASPTANPAAAPSSSGSSAADKPGFGTDGASIAPGIGSGPAGDGPAGTTPKPTAHKPVSNGARPSEH